MADPDIERLDTISEETQQRYLFMINCSNLHSRRYMHTAALSH